MPDVPAPDVPVVERIPTVDPPVRRWPGLAVAAWGLLFAVPSVVWATGHTAGADSTVSPALVRLARDGVTWFLAVLWLTAALKVFGALVGVGLMRRRGPRLAGPLVFCAGGAAVLLTWHGALFVASGVLIETGAVAVPADLLALTRWYLYLWGPWFVLGGLAFATAAVQYVRRCDGRRSVRACGLVGAVGALLLSVAATASGIA